MPALLDFLSLIADRGHSNSSKVVRYGTYAHERNLEITARITNLSGVYVCVICGARVGEEKRGHSTFSLRVAGRGWDEDLEPVVYQLKI